MAQDTMQQVTMTCNDCGEVLGRYTGDPLSFQAISSTLATLATLTHVPLCPNPTGKGVNFDGVIVPSIKGPKVLTAKTLPFVGRNGRGN